MLAAQLDLRLHQFTGERRYLERAHLAEAQRVARAAHRWFVTEGRLDGQPAFFTSIYFKNLLLLESVTGGTTYRDAMRDHADRMWDRHRDPATGLFSFGGDEGTETIEQAAMTQVLAVLAWPRGRYRDLY